MSRVAMHRMGSQMRRTLDRVLETGALNTAQVIFYYLSPQSEVPGFDPNVESTYVPQPLQSLTLPALVHFFGAKTEELTSGEIEAGDAVLTLRANAVIDGFDLQEFDIDGKRFVQKKVGRRLIEEWDLLVGGHRFARTIFVTKKK